MARPIIREPGDHPCHFSGTESFWEIWALTGESGNAFLTPQSDSEHEFPRFDPGITRAAARAQNSERWPFYSGERHDMIDVIPNTFERELIDHDSGARCPLTCSGYRYYESSSSATPITMYDPELRDHRY